MSKFLIAAAAASALAFGLSYASVPLEAKGEPKEETKKCPKGKKCLKDEATDSEIYHSGYWLARTGQYAAAIDMLNKSAVKDERVLTYIGFATRKLGDHDTAMDFYARALAMNPNYTVARAYMGEAFIAKGDIAKAKDQLAEIGTRCGVTCAEYNELKVELAKVGG
jgi:Tfp pilus assembly protein PilF